MYSRYRKKEYSWDDHQDFLHLFSKKRQEMIKNSLERANKEYEDLKDESEPRFSDRNHKIFVEQCLAPQGYLKGDNEVFAYVASIETDGEYHYANISVLTPLMAYVDERYFGLGQDYDVDLVWKEEYKPYYYEFIAVLDDEELKNFKKKTKSFKDEEGNGSWFKAKLLSLDSGEGFSGTLHYGGSESSSDGLTISNFRKINKDINKHLNDTYEIRYENNDYGDVLKRMIYKYYNFDVRVFNVGQANCIYIKSPDNEVRMFFDVGRPLKGYYNRKNKQYYPNVDLYDGTPVRNALDTLKDYNPNIIMISHWHLDHYSAYTDLNDAVHKATWIVPPYKKTMKSVNRLVKALKGNVIFVRDDDENKLFDNEYGFQLWRSPDHSNKDRNRDGLILRIHDTIFTGDSLYSYWPDELKTSLSDVTRIVVPHHCCSLNTSDIVENKAIIASFASKKKDAYICVGDNIYGHPDGGHETELKNHKFKLHLTSNCSSLYYDFSIQSPVINMMCDIYQCNPCPYSRLDLLQKILSGSLDEILIGVLFMTRSCIWSDALIDLCMNRELLRSESWHFFSGEECPYKQSCPNKWSCSTLRRDALRELLKYADMYDWYDEYDKYSCKAVNGNALCSRDLLCKNKPSQDKRP